MKVVAAVLAAGSGTRFGKDKSLLHFGGKALWRWSFDTFRAHPRIDAVGVVCSASNFDEIRAKAAGALFVEPGGATRAESSMRALIAMPPDTDIALIHDAARPFVSDAVVDRVIDGVERSGAAAPGLAVTDTVREVGADGTRSLDRSRLFTMQTPQGARRELLLRALEQGPGEATDELELLEQIGAPAEIVPGDPSNWKVTVPEDLARLAPGTTPSEVRTGIGYDVHAFSNDPARTLMLCCVPFPKEPGLEGHSDADAPAHALTDALLGAAGQGDIGAHFPNTDAAWAGAASAHFLRHASNLLQDLGWRITNIDVTVIAERPRIAERIPDMRRALATALSIEVQRTSVKATTNERLGALGRGEGIAAFAIATISRPHAGSESP